MFDFELLEDWAVVRGRRLVRRCLKYYCDYFEEGCFDYYYFVEGEVRLVRGLLVEGGYRLTFVNVSCGIGQWEKSCITRSILFWKMM